VGSNNRHPTAIGSQSAALLRGDIIREMADGRRSYAAAVDFWYLMRLFTPQSTLRIRDRRILING
jgi:hypothetical protein